MSNKVKNINIKNWTYYFFNGIISIENFDESNNKICTILDIWQSKKLNICSVNTLCLILKNLNGFFEKINRVSTNERK